MTGLRTSLPPSETCIGNSPEEPLPYEPLRSAASILRSTPGPGHLRLHDADPGWHRDAPADAGNRAESATAPCARASGRPRRCWRLSPSRSASCRTEAFLDGHVASFAFFGGVLLSILYDDLKIVVAKICGDGKRERTRAFTELVSHYLFATASAARARAMTRARSRAWSNTLVRTSWRRCRRRRASPTSTPCWPSVAGAVRAIVPGDMPVHRSISRIGICSRWCHRRKGARPLGREGVKPPP